MKKGIEYADKSWNPSTGCLMSSCSVGKNCWAYKMSKRLAGRFGYPHGDKCFEPTFHFDRMPEPLHRKKPTRYDTCFMGDIAYAQWEWVDMIIKRVRECPQHRFYFLTKRPDLLGDKDIAWPDNAWVGVSVNNQDDVWRIANLLEIDAKNLWVSFEPIYSSIMTSLKGISWCVLGAQSNPELQPDKEWVEEIIRCADYMNIPVFLKPNLTVVKPRMELPDELKMED